MQMGIDQPWKYDRCMNIDRTGNLWALAILRKDRFDQTVTKADRVETLAIH